MNPQFYEAENCTRKIEHNGRVFKFNPWGTVGGCLCGVYVAETKEEIESLDSLVKTPKSLVTKITEQDYAKRLNIRQTRQPLSFISADSGPGQKSKPNPAVVKEDQKIRVDVEAAKVNAKPTELLEAEIITKKVEPITKVEDILKPGKVDVGPNKK